MRQLGSLLILITLVSSAYGQEDLSKYQDTVFLKYNKDWSADSLDYQTDTLIFPTGMRRHFLSGTTILPWTENQQNAKGYGLYFDKISKSDCQTDAGRYHPPEDKINAILQSDTDLVIDINIGANCCHDFLCDIEVDSLGTLNLIYHGYGTYCSCECCFGLVYHFNVMKYKDLPKIKSVMINGDKKTLKSLNNK